MLSRVNIRRRKQRMTLSKLFLSQPHALKFMRSSPYLGGYRAGTNIFCPTLSFRISLRILTA